MERNVCSITSILILATLQVLIISPVASGQVSFIGPTQFDVGRLALSQTTADLNKDAHLDIAVVNREDNDISILFGDGTGQFGSRFDLSVLTSPRDVIIADFNKDTFLDLAVVHGGFGDRKSVV